MYPVSGYYRQPPGTAGRDINAPEAWDIHTGSSEIVVAVIDTGVNYNHRDMQGNIWVNINEIPGDGLDNDDNNYIDDFYGYDFCQNNQPMDSDPMDEMGHGTHVAGIIAARTDNSQDIAGVSWNAKIMAVKFLDRSGYGNSSDGAASILYATYNGADILSNSWGWPVEPEGPNDVNTVREAIEYAVSQGVIVVAAAGNNGISSMFYPAAYDNVISVAATDLS
jgi:subtilisin family serine protease